MFEVAGVSEEVAREALRLASHKLPVKCKFVKREKQVVKHNENKWIQINDRELTSQELETKIKELKEELFNLRFPIGNWSIRKYSSY